MAKRHRHRRALVRLLMEYNDDDRLVICVDPADLDLMRDFEADRCTTRILELDCDFTDDYLVGHAERLAAIDVKLKAHAGLILTGNAFFGIGLNDCVNAANKAGEQVIARLQSID